MVKLNIDFSTMKVLGYTKIDDEYNDRNGIYMEEENILGNLDALNSKKLYYDIESNELVILEQEESTNKKYYELKNEYDSLYDACKFMRMSLVRRVKSDQDRREIMSNLRKIEIKLSEVENRLNEIKAKKRNLVENNILSLFHKEESQINYNHFLSILCVVRDEDDYLIPWIKYHIEEIGVDHFYIYDNESKKPVKNLLDENNFEYIDKVTIVPWATSGFTQQDTYNDFLSKYRNETKWIIAMDPDERIYIKDKSEYATVKELLEDHENNTDPITCRWVHYNANGQIQKTEGDDMERFTTIVPFPGEDYKGKQLVMTNRIDYYHSHRPVGRFHDNLGEYHDGIYRGEISFPNFFQLNHYYTRSYEEWCEKMRRGTVHPGYARKFYDFFRLNPDLEYLNTGEDWEMEYGSNVTKEDEDDSVG